MAWFPFTADERRNCEEKIKVTSPDWADGIATQCISDGVGDDDTIRLIAAALRIERDACANLISSTKLNDILLAAGEMSQQERRTVMALLPWLAERIRKRDL